MTDWVRSLGTVRVAQLAPPLGFPLRLNTCAEHLDLLLMYSQMQPFVAQLKTHHVLHLSWRFCTPLRATLVTDSLRVADAQLRLLRYVLTRLETLCDDVERETAGRRRQLMSAESWTDVQSAVLIGDSVRSWFSKWSTDDKRSNFTHTQQM